MRQLSLLYTGNQQCYNVKYSPFDSSLLACVSCDKFGLSGSASLFILQYAENSFLNSKFQINESYRSNVSLFDVDWSPTDPNLLLTANGDGAVSLWRYPPTQPFDRKAIVSQRQHTKEINSVQWEPSGMRPFHFLSASWDQSIKIWNISNNGLTALTSLNGHESMVFSATWNPKMSGTLLSTSADKTFRIWDVNASSINSTPTYISKPNIKADILCCDWNKFDSNQFVLGYASGLIEIRDLRNLNGPPVRSIENAHDYAVRKVVFSPHFANLFGSVSYDMMTKLWTTNDGLIEFSQNHSEFAYGFDFDPKTPNRLVDCGWDRRVMISEFELSKKFMNYY